MRTNNAKDTPMNASTRGVARLLIAAGTAAAFAFSGLAAASAGAEPIDTAPIDPTTDQSNALPAVGVIEGLAREYVSPDVVPANALGPVNQFVEQFAPTTTQIREFFTFLQQSRAPATINRPIG
jgi:hypothetical protein